jgi:hypothetical protein
MTKSNITLDEYLAEIRADAQEYSRRFLEPVERIEPELAQSSVPLAGRGYRRAFSANHRKAWEQHFKVKIPAGYHIHHKDKDKTNNNPVNLLCCPVDVHILIHEMKGDVEAVKLLRKAAAFGPWTRTFMILDHGGSIASVRCGRN